MTLLVQSGLILLFMLGSALFSGMETGGYMLSRLRLRSRIKQGDHVALRLEKALKDSHLFIFTVLIGNNITVYLLSRQVTQLYLASGNIANAETAATLTLLLPMFIFCELLPKNLFRLKADYLMYHLSILLRFFQYLFSPINIFLKWFFHIMTAGRAGGETLSGFSLSLDGLREFFTEKMPENKLSEHQNEMIDNLVSMHKVSVLQEMKPFGDSTFISEDATVFDAVKLMREQKIEQALIFKKSKWQTNRVVRIVDLLCSEKESNVCVKQFSQKLKHISSTQSLANAFRVLRADPELPVLVQDKAGKNVGTLHLRGIAKYIVAES